MTKRLELDDLHRRLARLEVRLESMERGRSIIFAAMEQDRRIFVRHQQTLARHMRRILADNRELRIAKHTLIKYLESSSVRQ